MHLVLTRLLVSLPFTAPPLFPGVFLGVRYALDYGILFNHESLRRGLLTPPLPIAETPDAWFLVFPRYFVGVRCTLDNRHPVQLREPPPWAPKTIPPSPPTSPLVETPDLPHLIFPCFPWLLCLGVRHALDQRYLVQP